MAVRPLTPPPELRLTAAEREAVEAMLRSRERHAWTFTAVGGVAAAASMTYSIAGSCAGQHASAKLEALAVGVLVLSVIWSVVWYFGWTDALKLRRDLGRGTKQTLTGLVTSLTRAGSARGGTVTTAVINGRAVSTRTGCLDGIEEGGMATVEVLPHSDIALSATPISRAS
jgi:hypothetical protein